VSIDLVSAEECGVDPAVSSGGHVVPHTLRPVLVVPEGDDRSGAVEQVRVLVEVDIGGVAQRDPGAFREEHEGEFEVEEVPGALHDVGLVGPVERHGSSAAGSVSSRVLAEAVAAPAVVGLPRGHRIDDDDPALVGRAADRQGNELLSGLTVQAQ
jgi:hypothetical protein